VSRPVAADVAALQTALAAEQAASYGYGIVGSHLAGKRFAAAASDCVAHERARDRLTSMISARGGQPSAAAAAYRLPISVHSAATAVALAVHLERHVTAAYLGLVAAPDPALRRFAAQNMRACAVRAAQWSGRTQAFPGLPASSLQSHGQTQMAPP
jgi:hypothetical protein